MALNNHSLTQTCESRFFGQFKVLSGSLLFKAKCANVQFYHGENTLPFDDIIMMFDLQQINTLDWIFIVLAY
jgi:hypothetical protein